MSIVLKELTVGKNDVGKRLDAFILKVFPTMPQSLLYKYIRTKKIKINRKRTELNYRLCEGDLIQCYIDEEFTVSSPDEAFKKLKGSLEIVYEDENILLVDKKPGLLAHSGNEEGLPTLIDEIKAYLYKKGEYIPEDELSFSPALCNRIDRNTGGIVIAAKNAESLRIMNDKIKTRELEKRYLCAVHGKLPSPFGELTAYLFKDSTKGRSFVYDTPGKGRMKIVTEYTVKDFKDGLSLLEVNLITGKTHQIRAHMAHIGFPLLGEGKYGVNKEDKKLGYKHQALYSYKLKFLKSKEKNLLSYLDGKEFTVKKENIYFLENF